MPDSAPPEPPQSPSRDARADAIVDEAMRLFSARGFRGTTVAAVAKGVNLTDAGVLHHFPTKRDLLAAVLQRSTQDQAEFFRSTLAGGGIEALRRMGEWGQIMEKAPQFMGLEVTLSAEALDGAPDLREFFTVRYRLVRRWLVAAVREGMQRGEIRADVDPDQEVAALIAFLDGMRLQWFFAGPVSLDERVSTYVDQLIERISVERDET